jgi:protein-arginine kinase activator protein McsA
MDVCNQLSNELKLENKIEQFKEALQEVIRKHDFREVNNLQ